MTRVHNLKFNGRLELVGREQALEQATKTTTTARRHQLLYTCPHSHGSGLFKIQPQAPHASISAIDRFPRTIQSENCLGLFSLAALHCLSLAFAIFSFDSICLAEKGGIDRPPIDSGMPD